MHRRNDDSRHPEAANLADAGGMRARIAAFDWAATPLGARDRWTPSLRWIVEVILASGCPMAVRWGPDLIMIYNDAYAVLLGERHPKALGRPTREIWPEIWDRLGPISLGMLNGDRDAFFAVDHAWMVQRHGEREEARFTISYSPVPDPATLRGIGGLLVTAVETTGRVRNEDTLRLRDVAAEKHRIEALGESERQFRALVDSVTDYAFIKLDPKGVVSSWNAGAERIKGYSAGEIIGQHFSRFYTPEDRAAGLPARSLSIAESTGKFEAEAWRMRKDGTRFFANVVIDAMRDESGKLVGFAKITRDITERQQREEALRQSERQFRALIDGVTDYAFIMLDPNGIVSSWNAGAERIKGYSAGEIIGQHFSRFYTPEDRASGLPARSLSTAESTGKFEAEAWRLRKDGTQFFANVVIDAIRDENGKLIGFAKITRDITERREAQEALHRTQAQLAHSQKMEALGQLTGGVAHDFNNLLMIVSGQAQAMMRRTKDLKDVRSLEAIVAAAARGETLTRQLLTFSRRQPLNPRTVRLEHAVARFRDMLTGSVPGNIALDFAISPGVWVVAIDAAEFELALVNLVINARDAMPDGGRVTVAAENVTFAGNETDEGLTGEFVALSVSDTGTGIPPQVMSKLFEPFFTTKSPGKGTGLGLSQVYGFARQSGGGVTVRSDVGHGTRVTILLPRSHAPAVDIVTSDAPVQISGGNEHILVVEDNSDVRTVAVTLLEQLNYRTHAVETAMQALDLLDTGAKVDLVFSDVMLPGEFDGLELARILRSRHPAIPILLTSGYARALAGRHDLPILRKPYQMAALGESIRSTLAKRTRAAKA